MHCPLTLCPQFLQQRFRLLEVSGVKAQGDLWRLHMGGKAFTSQGHRVRCGTALAASAGRPWLSAFR